MLCKIIFGKKIVLFWSIYNYEKDIKTNGVGIGEIG
jgi:hypothetical protein